MNNGRLVAFLLLGLMLLGPATVFASHVSDDTSLSGVLNFLEAVFNVNVTPGQDTGQTLANLFIDLVVPFAVGFGIIFGFTYFIPIISDIIHNDRYPWLAWVISAGLAFSAFQWGFTRNLITLGGSGAAITIVAVVVIILIDGALAIRRKSKSKFGEFAPKKEKNFLKKAGLFAKDIASQRKAHEDEISTLKKELKGAKGDKERQAEIKKELKETKGELKVLENKESYSKAAVSLLKDAQNKFTKARNAKDAAGDTKVKQQNNTIFNQMKSLLRELEKLVSEMEGYGGNESKVIKQKMNEINRIAKEFSKLYRQIE